MRIQVIRERQDQYTPSGAESSASSVTATIRTTPGNTRRNTRVIGATARADLSSKGRPKSCVHHLDRSARAVLRLPPGAVTRASNRRRELISVSSERCSRGRSGAATGPRSARPRSAGGSVRYEILPGARHALHVGESKPSGGNGTAHGRSGWRPPALWQSASVWRIVTCLRTTALREGTLALREHRLISRCYLQRRAPAGQDSASGTTRADDRRNERPGERPD
jgi:hypothetical protein